MKHVFQDAQTTQKYYVVYLKENVDIKLNVHTECESWNQSSQAQVTISRLKPSGKNQSTARTLKQHLNLVSIYVLLYFVLV